jgi:hypothetical protein
MTTREQVIETQIRTFLNLKGIFAWKAKTTGTYDPVKKVFRKNAGQMKGVADIIGIYKKRFMAIEVKSDKGRLSPEQKVFLRRVVEEGGLAMVARSVSDVQAKLKEWDVA